jgi:hypothetical protein
MVTIHGKYVRVEVHREGDIVELCISRMYDIACEDSIVLIARAEDLKEKAEELVNEIVSLIRRALDKLEEQKT